MSENLVEQVENMKNCTESVIDEFEETACASDQTIGAEDANDADVEPIQVDPDSLTVCCIHANCREMFASEEDRDAHAANTCVATKIGSRKTGLNDIWREKGHATSYHIRQCAGARGSISALFDAAENEGGEEVVCAFGGPRNYPRGMMENVETRKVDKDGKLPFEVTEAQEYRKKQSENDKNRLAVLKAKADEALANLNAEKERQKLALELAKDRANSDDCETNGFVAKFGVPMDKKSTKDAATASSKCPDDEKEAKKEKDDGAIEEQH